MQESVRLRSTPSEHLKRFYVDTVTASARTVRYICDFFGADHVMYGTDHPFWPMPPAHAALEAAQLSATELASVEHATAARLFGI